LPQCGDGTLNVTAGEQCDDGNRNPSDGCTNDCTVCGDGMITPPEECDGGDGCDAQCRRPRVVGTGTPQSCTEAAFEAALAQRSVTFNCGRAPVTIRLRNEKAITAATTIDGGGRVTLSGGGTVRVFAVSWNAGLDLRNLTIADGRIQSPVGGEGGGGIRNDGTLMLTNCTLSGNSAAGVGSYLGLGGAIFNGGTLVLANSTLNDNSVAGDSGGSGGGIANWGGTAMLTNCTMRGNSTTLFGGGIANYGGCSWGTGCWGGTVTLTNCTLSGNSATEGGGAIYNGAYFNGRNTIIANSPSGGDCSGEITDGGHNLQFPGTDCGWTIPTLDPRLDRAGLQDNGGPTQTIALLPGSPAINAGDAEVCANPPVNGGDQRGFARPGTGHTECSIGAYEADAFSPEPCVGDCDGTGSVTIDELITLVNIALGTAQASACPHGVPSGAEVDVALIIHAVNVALNGCGLSPAEQGCLTSGGTVSSAMCCASSGNFPNTCAIGVCGCAPAASHEVRVCDCGADSCFDSSGCVRQ
jgi:cysteine-rich repeat protein/predicted outer membrane repeat protein